jgi:hypothetical protein
LWEAAVQTRLVLAGVLSFVSAIVGGLVTVWIALPPLVEAQDARIRAEALAIVGAGSDRAQFVTQWEGQGSELYYLDPDGTRRLAIGVGGIDATDPDGSGISVFDRSGTAVARFGMGRGPLGNLPLSTSVILWDQEGHPRVRISVAEDGTPVMQMLDADGAVTWSAL